jgi:hypothetical protein
MLTAAQCKEYLDSVRDIEAAGLLLWVEVMKKIREGKETLTDEDVKHALGFESAASVDILLQHMAWSQKATEEQIAAGIGYGGFTLSAGLTRSKSEGVQDNTTVHIVFQRVFQTEGFSALLPALGIPPPITPVGPVLPVPILLPVPNTGNPAGGSGTVAGAGSTGNPPA